MDEPAMTPPVQPAPVPNERPAVWDLVIADMRARDHVGRQRYGTPLQAHNGRDTLRDAYEEALDLAVYLRTLIEERAVPDGASADDIRRAPCPDCGAEWSFTTVPAMGWLLRHADDCPTTYPTPWQNAGFSGRIRMWGSGAAATVGSAGWVVYGLDGLDGPSGPETGEDGERMADLALLDAAIRRECERAGIPAPRAWGPDIGAWSRHWSAAWLAATVYAAPDEEGWAWLAWSRRASASCVLAHGPETGPAGRLAADRALLAWLRTQPDGGGA